MRKKLMRWLFTLFYLLVTRLGKTEVYEWGYSSWSLGPWWCHLWVEQDVSGLWGGVHIPDTWLDDHVLFSPFNTY